MNKASGRPLAIFAAVFAAMATRLFAGHYSWTTTGPEPGQVLQILSYASDPNRLYVIDSYYGGYLFRSDDRAQNWCYLDTIVPGYVVADPTNPDVLYSPYPPGVQKSTDGGSSWTSASSGLPSGFGNSLVLAPSDPSTLYVYMSPGNNLPWELYRSDDGAATWSPVGSSVLPSYWPLTVDAFDPNTLYRSGGPAFDKSTDGGGTWSPAGAGLPEFAQKIFSDPTTPGRVWAAVGQEGLYLSVDGGASFVPAQAGMEGQYVRDMAFDRGAGAALYAAAQGTSGGYGSLFVSHDSGAGWDPIDLGIGSYQATAIALDSADPARIYVGAGLGLRGGLLKTADGGTTWTRSQKGLSGYYTYAVAAHPGLPSATFAFSGANFFGTLDAGGNWAPLPSPGLTVTSLLFDPTSPSVLYGQYDSGVYKSIDGGGSWTNASAGLPSTGGGYHLAIGTSDPAILLASTYSGVFKTTNAGGSWENVLPGYSRAVAVDPADPEILYASLSNGGGVQRFQRSPDGGMTWETPAGWGPYGYPFDIAIPPNDPSVVYALTSTNLMKSIDRGLSFAPSSEGLPGTDSWLYYRLALDPTSPETLYAATGSGGTVFRSTDGAASWRPLGRWIPVLSTTDFAVSATGRDLYAATIAGIFQYHRSFSDVPDADPFWVSVDAAAMTGVTAGCGGGRFCPTAANTRSQIAPMLLRAIEGAGYAPPAATGAVFADVPATSFAAAWIEELALREIAAGCGSGDYCPSSPMTRAALAVMLLKAKHGSDYEPPPATGTVFLDVPVDAFAAAWIEQLAAEGITAGCGGGYFCPDGIVVRSQAAALIVKTFGLS
jgi:photosystem II stability/assembly factor-like uncharacterized protein